MTQITIPYFADAIPHCWSRETSFDPAGWSEDNIGHGQCLVTALVARDIFGGAIVKGLVDGVEHYWNFLSSIGEVDFTRLQFGDGPRSTTVLACSLLNDGGVIFNLRPDLPTLTEEQIAHAGSAQDLLRRYTALRTKFAFDQMYPHAYRMQTTETLGKAIGQALYAAKAKNDGLRRRMNCPRCNGGGLIDGTPPIWKPDTDSYIPGEGSQICPCCKDGQL